METTEFVRSYGDRLYLTTDDAVEAINMEMKRAKELGVMITDI